MNKSNNSLHFIANFRLIFTRREVDLTLNVTIGLLLLSYHDYDDEFKSDVLKREVESVET